MISKYKTIVVLFSNTCVVDLFSVITVHINTVLLRSIAKITYGAFD